LHSASITELHDGRKLFLGAEFERGALVQDDLFVGPPMERSREFAAANLQAESYVEREHNARRTAPGVAHATSGIKANVLTLLFAPQHCRARPAQSLPQSACGKEVEQGQSVPITTSGFTKEQYKRQMLDLDAKPQEGMIFHSAGQDSCESRVFDI
jgi:hypothetical protein